MTQTLEHQTSRNLASTAQAIYTAFKSTRNLKRNEQQHAQEALAYLSRNYPNFKQMEQQHPEAVNKIILKAARTYKGTQGASHPEDAFVAAAKRLASIKHHSHQTARNGHTLNRPSPPDTHSSAHAPLSQEELLPYMNLSEPTDEPETDPNRYKHTPPIYEDRCPTCELSIKVRARRNSTSEPISVKTGKRTHTVWCHEHEKQRAIDIAQHLMLRHEDDHMEHLMGTLKNGHSRKPEPIGTKMSPNDSDQASMQNGVLAESG